MTEFPPRRPAFYQAIREARLAGLWVKAARRVIPGQGRFVVTAPNSSTHLFSHDDIEEVRAWIWCADNPKQHHDA